MLPASAARPRPVLKALPSPFLPCFKLLPLSRPKARDEQARPRGACSDRVGGQCKSGRAPLYHLWLFFTESWESPTMIGAKPAHLLLLLFLPAKSASPHFHLCPVPHSRGRCQLLRLAVGRKRERDFPSIYRTGCNCVLFFLLLDGDS